MNYYHQEKGLKAIFENGVLCEMCRKAEACFPNETGGLLVGKIDEDGVAHVLQSISPAKEIVCTGSYYREVRGMEKVWRGLNKKGMMYLGEWHSHPNGSTRFSSADLKAMKGIYEDEGVILSKPLMVIIGVKNGALTNEAVYAYEGKQKELIELKKMVDLRGLFGDLQNEMEASLGTFRRNVDHPSIKGDATELKWIDFLRKYLPDKYKVNKAMVIDSEGNRSAQIDVVIYDAVFTPFIFNEGETMYIPAEGVYAVFEVKPQAQGNIEYAGDKVASVRKLKRTSTSIINAGRHCDPRNLTKIIGGILSTTAGFSKDTLKEHLQKLTGLNSLDCGCCLDLCAFRCKFDNDYTIEGKDQVAVTNYYNTRSCKDVVFSGKDNSLFTFFFQLNYYLKEIGTVPAIDINAYLKAIGEEIDVPK